MVSQQLKDNQVSSLAPQQGQQVPRMALGDSGVFAHRRHSQSDKQPGQTLGFYLGEHLHSCKENRALPRPLPGLISAPEHRQRKEAASPLQRR